MDAKDFPQLWSELKKKRWELDTIIIDYQRKGAILRSKTQWYNDREEGNTKCFLNLEKRQGTIAQLKMIYY